MTTWWPMVRRLLILIGAANGCLAAIFWLNGTQPFFNGTAAFIGMVAFLLGAKAQDDPS